MMSSYMQQYVWNSKTLCSVKEARHKGTNIALSYLYQISKISKSIKKSDHCLPGPRERANRVVWLLNGLEVFSPSDENVLVLDRGSSSALCQ